MSPRFATTQWSVVLAARDGSESEARVALEELCTSLPDEDSVTGFTVEPGPFHGWHDLPQSW